MQASKVHPEVLESLPAEIFYAIIEQVLDTIGFLKAVGLQRVSKSWNAAIVHVICHDHLHNAHGVVNRVLEKKPTSRIGYRTVGTLLIAELKHNPNQRILKSLGDAIQAQSTVFRNVEDLLHFQRTVCEAVSERLCWAPDRSHNGSWTIHFRNHYCDPHDHEWKGSYAMQEMNICMAIMTNNVSALQTFLGFGLPIVKRTRYLANKQMRYFGKPLHLAARYAGLEVIQTLLDCEARIHALQYMNERHVQENMLSNAGSALRVAALSGRYDVVRLLLPFFRSFPDVRWANNEKSKIVLAAARQGDPVLVSLLLENLWADRGNVPPDLREEILFEAVYMGRIEAVKSMLDNGVSANVQKRELLSSWPRPPWTAQYSPLQTAVFRGRTDIAKLLLDRGAKLEFGGKHGPGEKDLLYYATSGGYETTVQLLLDYGIHLDKKGRKFEAVANKYILEDVARSDQIHIMRLLLENGASLGKDSSNPKSPRGKSIGESSLVIAINHGNLPMVLCLLESGVVAKTLARKLELISMAENSNRNQIFKLLLDLRIQDTNPARHALERITNIWRGASATRIEISRLEPVENESILFHSQGRY